MVYSQPRNVDPLEPPSNRSTAVATAAHTSCITSAASSDRSPARRHHVNTSGLYTWTSRCHATGSDSRRRVSRVGDVPPDESGDGSGAVIGVSQIDG